MESLPESNQPAPNGRAKAQEFKNSGNDKFNQNNYKAAIADYKKGLLHEPNNSDLHSNLSAAYIQLEKYIEAEEHALFAICLKPNFYKGYMRAAKAAHGKAMTRLSLKRLTAGLQKVTDPLGIKELTRLKNQYTAYMSLPANADKEIEIDSDHYQSEDEYSISSDEEDDDLENNDDTSPASKRLLAAANKPAVPTALPKSAEPAMSNKAADRVTKVPANLTEPPKSAPISTSSPAGKSAVSSVAKEDSKRASSLPKEELKKTVPSTKKERKRSSSLKEESKKDVASLNLEDTRNTNCQFEKTNKPQPEKEPENLVMDICKDPNVNKHVTEFKDCLKTGGEAYLSGNYRKAADSYKAAKERVGIKLSDYEIDDRMYNVIKYAYCAALIHLNCYDDLVKAIQELTSMNVYELSIPALHVQVAKAYCRLNRFKSALEPLEKVQENIENHPIYPTFTWPGTEEIIQETTPNGLKNTIKELMQLCRVPHKPTAVCRYDNCLKTSTHILPSELIYSSDPDFVGYVRMVCEEKCHIEFHTACWKAYKESVSGVGKLNDKDLLGCRCLTTDCVNSERDPSSITMIEIIDADNQVKSINKIDNKAAPEESKKSKKKRSKVDDKEKVSKAKKVKENKAKDIRKQGTAAIEEEDDANEKDRLEVDAVKTLELRKGSLAELRQIKFGTETRSWDPRLAFYGRPEETLKASFGQFLDHPDSERVEVRDAKEFLFSYFMSILKEEGPLKQSDVEELWKESAGGFCDIKVVLPNLKTVSELLLESTRFCQLEDYICLSDQVEEAYTCVRREVAETVTFLMTGSAAAAAAGQVTTLSTTAASTLSDALPDLLNHPQSVNHLFLMTSGSEEDTYSDESGDESDDSEEESDEENCPESSPSEFIEPEVLKEQPTEQIQSQTVKPGGISLRDLLKEMNLVKSSLSGMNNVEKKEEEEQEPVVTERVERPVSPAPTVDLHELDNTETTDSSDVRSETNEKHSELPENCSNTCPKVLEVENTKVSHIGSGDSESTTSLVMEPSSQVSSGEGRPKEYPEKSDKGKNESVGIHSDLDKASQIDILMQEKHMQTVPLKTKDNLSQTNECDLNQELKEKIRVLTTSVEMFKECQVKMTKEINNKEQTIQRLKTSVDLAAKELAEESKKSLESQKTLKNRLKEFTKKEAELKKHEEELKKSNNDLKKLYSNVVSENSAIKDKMGSIMKDIDDMQDKWSVAMTNIEEYEKKYIALEQNLRTKLKTTQQAQLQTIKAYWESQVSLLRRRCVEKISEMQNWFSMFPPAEVEELPSWTTILQVIHRWKEVSTSIQKIELEFSGKYRDLEGRIASGKEVEDLNTLMLPSLPEEPSPLPLDRITVEITEKHVRKNAELNKKVAELTQLVANQQLEIEKSKEANHQIHQLMTSFNMVPRLQTPMTTAFGSLALQYSYPQTSDPSPFASSSSSGMPTVPPPIQKPSKMETSTNFGNFGKFDSDVQTLLHESSKAVSFKQPPPTTTAAKDDLATSSMMSNYPFLAAPPPTPNPVAPPPSLAFPPPPIGVAQSVLKASAAALEKDQKPVERSAAPKVETVLVTITPHKSSAPAQTPEKGKKKKKGREAKEAEARLALAAASSSESVAAGRDLSTKTPEEEVNDWTVVGDNRFKQPFLPTPAPVADSKLKNKKKLLDKLQLRFPTTPLKDLDDIVKLVREQNLGSLSGLPFDEIEARVERFITKRHFQKTSSMGLVKFSEAAWGAVKQPQVICNTNLIIDECTICLESMESSPFTTKIDCNHEFHTQCLRKWLREKRVCPLCNKFAAMPDEFPALS